MLSEHQAKFISNSIFLSSKKFIISNAEFFFNGRKKSEVLANLVSEKTVSDVKCMFCEQSLDLKAEKSLRNADLKRRQL
jgi:hypothetical protein